VSMPDISLEVIDPRIALAGVVASIALQEAAVSHVLNAEGEKIQAVVGMEDASVGDLQSINLTVGNMVDNVALFEDVLQNKLRTALLALYPTADLTIRVVDSYTHAPVNCQCALAELTDISPGAVSTVYARGDALALPGLKPGGYSLHMLDACAGYAPETQDFAIEVDARGRVTFDGAAVTGDSPAVIGLAEDPYGLAAQPEEAPPEETQAGDAQPYGYQAIPFGLFAGQFETPGT